MLLRLGKGKPHFAALRARLWKNEVFFFTPSASLCQQLLAWVINLLLFTCLCFPILLTPALSQGERSIGCRWLLVEGGEEKELGSGCDHGWAEPKEEPASIS